MSSHDRLQRSSLLDFIRGVAVILMLIFHFSYDLNNFGYWQFDLYSPFWFWFPRLIVFLFLIAVGASLPLAVLQNKMGKEYWKRIGKVGGYAVLITIITYIMYPENWVYFGTLHCIFLASVMTVPLLNYHWVRRILIALMVAIWFGFDLTWKSLSIFPIKSMDYIPIYPWWAVVLLGVDLSSVIAKNRTQFWNPVLVLGRHSLNIYLLHQPIIFGVLKLYQMIS